MKRLIPLALVGLLAACGNPNGGHCADCDRQKDALSDRTMGATRNVHGAKQDHYDHRNHDHYRAAPAPGYVVVPAQPTPVYRADGTYYVAPAVVDHGRRPSPSEDALSDRSMGNSRGSHGEPMTAKDMNNDGTYDYVPNYAPRGNTWRYEY